MYSNDKTPLWMLPKLGLYIAAFPDKRYSLRLARASAKLRCQFGSDRPTELLGIESRNTEESILESYDEGDLWLNIRSVLGGYAADHELGVIFYGSVFEELPDYYRTG